MAIALTKLHLTFLMHILSIESNIIFDCPTLVKTCCPTFETSFSKVGRQRFTHYNNIIAKFDVQLHHKYNNFITI